MIKHTDFADSEIAPLMAQLVSIQNRNTHIDMLSILGFAEDKAQLKSMIEKAIASYK